MGITVNGHRLYYFMSRAGRKCILLFPGTFQITRASNVNDINKHHKTIYFISIQNKNHELFLEDIHDFKFKVKSCHFKNFMFNILFRSHFLLF